MLSRRSGPLVMPVSVLLLVALGTYGDQMVEVKWTQTDFEENIAYNGIGVASYNAKCIIDSMAHNINWDDGSTGPVPHGGQTGQYPNPPGVYVIYALPGHKYPTAKTYNAVIHTSYHCSHVQPGDTTFDTPGQITVHNRTPLDYLKVEKTTVKGGEPIKIEVRTTAMATPANIRIDVAWQDPNALIVPDPRSIVIPSGFNVVNFEVQTKPTRRQRTAKLTVSTVGPQKTQTITITP
jgi:hypothetical protein